MQHNADKTVNKNYNLHSQDLLFGFLCLSSAVTQVSLSELHPQPENIQK